MELRNFGQGLGVELSLKQSEYVNGEVVTRHTTETKTTPFFSEQKPNALSRSPVVRESLKGFGLLRFFLPPLPYVGKFRIWGT